MCGARSIALAAVSAAILLVLPACNESPTAPSASLIRTDLLAGTGAEAVAGRPVTVHYTGWFHNPEAPNAQGAEFDSSRSREPFTFTLGVGQVIAGWDQGVVGMRVGGVRRLVIPPSLAYGPARNASIPPHATLLFDIELLSVD